MGNSIGSMIPSGSSKIEERKKICSKFKACKNDKLYRELLKSEGIPVRNQKKNKSKKLKKRYSKRRYNKS
jgi:hypothetical protein